MSKKPESNEAELIIALTEGIGPDLGRKARFAFFELRDRLYLNETFSRLDLQARADVLDILSLATFYTAVISPLESSNAVLTLTQTASASHIRIGRDKLTTSLALQFGLCARRFKAILDQHKIPIAILSFATLDSFLENVLLAKEKGERETLD